MTTTWTIAKLDDKPRQGGGIVMLDGVAVNQLGIAVADAHARILVSRRPATDAT
jgi:acyl dehydratase